jgi:hypothetical protein
MIGWQTALVAYLVASFFTAGLLGRHLAAVRRRYPPVVGPRTDRKEETAVRR